MNDLIEVYCGVGIVLIIMLALLSSYIAFKVFIMMYEYMTKEN